MKFWKDAIPDPLQTLIPTNEALTIKQWIELIQVEHSYHSAGARAESPAKTSPAVETAGIGCNDAGGSRSSQLECLINKLSETDDDSTTEVIVYQTDSDCNKRQELQELSDFDPYKLTHIEVQQTRTSSSQSSNSFSVQVFHFMQNLFAPKYSTFLTSCW